MTPALPPRAHRNLRTFKLSAVGVSCLAVIMSNCSAATASTNEESPVLAALSGVTQNSTDPGSDVLSNVANVPTDDDGATAINSSVDGTGVRIPTDPADPVVLTSASIGGSISITLPFSEEAADAQVETPGVVSFDNHNNTSTAPVVKDDGGVQVNTVIVNANAPSRYEYRLSTPAGSSIRLDEDGIVEILDSNGDMQAGVAPAWAKDSNGADVASHYELNGSTLTQVVDLSGGDIAYPVVADPFLGINLLTGVYRNRPGGYSYKNGVQWSTRLSTWGMTVWTGAALGVGAAVVGNQIVRTKGWSEFTSRGGPSTTTVHQQYECHVTFGYNIKAAGFWWDFETARQVHNNWLTDPQRCNWA